MTEPYLTRHDAGWTKRSKTAHGLGFEKGDASRFATYADGGNAHFRLYKKVRCENELSRFTERKGH